MLHHQVKKVASADLVDKESGQAQRKAAIKMVDHKMDV